MRVRLAYGDDGIDVDFPDGLTTVVEPRYIPSLPDEEGALRTAIRNPLGTRPLRQLVSAGQTVAISVCDVTRPAPTRLMLPAILRELSHVPRNQVTVLIATGTHRANTRDELISMLGSSVVDGYPVVNHDAFDEGGLEMAGQTSDGIPILLNRHWLRADVRITLGLVEPHFFAGFSGGPKMVAPGLAGFGTTMHLHNAARIGSPRATWGITEGNPVHDSVREIATMTGVDFSLDVTINRDMRITAAYAGEMFEVHAAACEAARRTVMRPVDRPFEVVVTTNSGYPLDQNLYQAVKGMSAAAEIVREGGTIICAAECRDGVPDHGEYGRILRGGRSPEPHPSRWQVAGGAAKPDRVDDGDDPRPVAGADTGQVADEGGGILKVLPPYCRAGERSPPQGHGRHCGDGCQRAEKTRRGITRMRATGGSSDGPLPDERGLGGLGRPAPRSGAAARFQQGGLPRRRPPWLRPPRALPWRPRHRLCPRLP